MGPTKQAAVIARGDFACTWCASALAPPARDGGTADNSATVDHLDADHRNHAASNLVPACRSCNNYRRWADLFELHLRTRGQTPEAGERRAREQVSRPLDLAAGKALAARWQPERRARCTSYQRTYLLRRAGLIPSVVSFP